MSTTIEQTRASWHGIEMSAQEFLALPDDGIHRELVRGRVREDREPPEGGRRGSELTVRNRFHSRIVIRVGQVLANWMMQKIAYVRYAVKGKASTTVWKKRRKRGKGDSLTDQE